jgi:glycosyltransferase involved in cell wall biosynthesis
MKILHWMKKENSGMARSTLEIVNAEQQLGHGVCIRQPGENMPLYGVDRDMDVHSVHSQLNLAAYFDRQPKVMWMHGEPLSSVGNGISMKAIVDLATLMDCFICMRKDELPVWSSIKRTYLVPKGIDLDVFKPVPGVPERLSGEPAVLYVENWRGQRNPLYLCTAFEEVHRALPHARLHLYNCGNKKMQQAFESLIANNKWWPFIRTLQGPVSDINGLYNKADMVVSCLYPLYARGIEAFGAGKAFIGPGYREHDYPFQCELDPHSMARAIIDCWERFTDFDFRNWAEQHHDVRETVRQAVSVYERYL